MKSKNRFLNFFFLAIISIVPLGLLVAFLCPYIPPTTMWMPNMIGLGFPFLLATSIILGVIYLFLLKRKCIFFFAAVLINIPNIINYIRISSSNAEPQYTEQSIKVISYNVNLFDFYAHINKQDVTRKKIIDFIPSTKADIICFEEYYETKNGYFSIAEELYKAGYLYHTTRDQNSKAYYGNVIYSRYPILNEGATDGLSSLYAHYADILVSNKDTLRVFNMHLYSNKLNKDDHAFYNDLIHRKENTNYKEGASRILSKIRYSASVRQNQISLLLKSIADVRYPVILCGDMNETPISYSYNEFSKNLNDIFLEFGTGTGSTYNGIFPAYRIDYIFYRQSLSSNKRKIEPIYFSTYSVAYSDHFPIAATFQIK